MFDAKVLIKRLPSFSVPKIAVIQHVKPILKLQWTWQTRTVLWKNARTLKVSLWYASLLTNTRFRFLYFRIRNCQRIWSYIKTKKLPNDSGRLSSYNNFTDKKQNGCCSEAVLLRFLYWTESSSPSFKVRCLQMTTNLALV